MTPRDESGLPQPADSGTTLLHTLAILLHGGRTLLLFEGAIAPPPVAGSLIIGERAMAWAAECWLSAADGWCGLAVLDALPMAEGRVEDATGRAWRIGVPRRIDVAPQPLADLVRKAGADSRAVFGFLAKHLLVGSPSSTPETRAHQAFARDFLTAAAERDGFVEVLATPSGGGLFAQGWSLSLGAGPTTLASVADDLAVSEVEVALFARDDILPPGHGFCVFGKSWHDPGLATIDAVFFEKDGRLLRLDVVRGSVLQLNDDAATAHLAAMLPRLRAPDDTLRAFRRTCRPRYMGEETLAATTAPIAAALDALLQAPDGALLAIGWLLDPLRRVNRVLIKSTANLYAPLNADWSLLPRPDLNRGFAADPRFIEVLDDQDTMHGFIVHAPARRDQTEGAQVYLELVLDDESCLFRPLTVTLFDSAERLPQVLASLSPAEPELARIVETHLAPFLANVSPAARRPRRGAARPIRLGPDGAAREVSAIMPFRKPAELQPVLALLAGAPDAGMLDLALVTSRAVAEEVLPRLGDAFEFYGLKGSLVIASEHETGAGWLDIGVAATDGPQVLCWTPAALPKGPGWLQRLTVEAAGLAPMGLLSPALTYEDGSICFGGEGLYEGAASGARAGYGAGRLTRGRAARTTAGAAEIALIDREALARAGGFAGQLFSDAFAHVDLAARLRRAGFATWCSGVVEFWMLDDHTTAEAAPFDRLMRQVDAALLDRRGRSQPGDPTP